MAITLSLYHYSCIKCSFSVVVFVAVAFVVVAFVVVVFFLRRNKNSDTLFMQGDTSSTKADIHGSLYLCIYLKRKYII